MRHRDALVGVLVLGLLLGAGYWARQRSLPSEGSPAGSVASEALPDLSARPAVIDAGGGVRVTVAVDPSPPVAMATFRIRVRAERNGTPLDLQGGRVSFTMAMPMGDHRYGLRRTADGWQAADVVLPVCPSGGRRWFAAIDGDLEGRPRTLRARLDLAPPR